MKYKYPNIFLAVDNCFASKRWTDPVDWMSMIKDMGIYHVEASADNECDPLYSSVDYLDEWVEVIMNESVKSGVQIANLYSGHGTYSTLGLSHTSRLNRVHIRDNWLKPMIRTAAKLNAGMGFFCHAFNQNVLNNASIYKRVKQELIKDLSVISEYAARNNLAAIGVEQMYTPHQIPWTINGAYEILSKVFQLSGNPFYITIDVGHQTGQKRFLMPDSDLLKSLIKKVEQSGVLPDTLWLGTPDAYRYFSEALKTNSENKRDSLISLIVENCDEHSYLFSKANDGDPFRWLSELGCYSPIIHLQQTDGYSSVHQPFTTEFNAKGIIDGHKVLNALKESYEKTDIQEMPQKSNNIYLTLEVFASTAELPSEIVSKMNKSVQYWRKYIPKDGLKLNELI